MSLSRSLSSLKKTINLIVEPDHPRLKYKPRDWQTKLNIKHWGQRKLLLSEILFLTRWGHLSNMVVYAGAAPGNHLHYLSELFPEHKFILIDPNPFQIVGSEKIEIINDYFTNEIAKRFVDSKVLFISDIRTADHRQMSQKENEEYIIKDNNSQIAWVNLMKPAKSMLKFRCPYPNIIDQPTLMFKGIVFLQIWPPPSSTETRLIVDDSFDIIEYDNLIYEEQLFYHNSVTRYKKYPQPIKGEGLDDSYDACAEVLILYEFLEKFPIYKGKDVYKTISEMSYNISRAITKSGRTLAISMKNPEHRRNFPQIDHTVFYEII